MDTEAACINNDPPIRSSIASTIAISKDMAIIHYMTNRILLQKAATMANGILLVPFSCSDIGDMHLHLPAYDRTDAENAMAKAIHSRLDFALSKAGYQLLSLSFTTMHLTVKPTNPVN